jgi:hypothetical protein
VEAERSGHAASAGRGTPVGMVVGIRLECMHLGLVVVALIVASTVALAVACLAGPAPTTDLRECMQIQFVVLHG